MKRQTILVEVIIVTILFSAIARGGVTGVTLFSDDFSTDTTANYDWAEEGEGDGDPSNNYVYDASNEWLTITTANNNNVYMSLGGSLATQPQSGYFEFSFMPYQTYPTDGLVEMRLYGAAGISDMYVWHFAHNSGLPDAGLYDQYRARLEKWIGGTPVIEEIFIPTPDHYDLDEWHTLAMDFSPTTLSGYLDGQLIMSVSDPAMNPISITGFQLVFKQQDQHIDDIYISTDSVPVPIPIPSSFVLASLGFGIVNSRLRRHQSK